MRRVKAVRAGLLALVVTAVTVFAAPTPSMAGGDQYFVECEGVWASCQTGAKVAGPVGVCLGASAYYHSTIVCVDYDGDYVYVKDNNADGYSATAQIDSDRGDVLTRICRNNHGHGTWARCNFNWSEAGRKTVSGGYLTSYADMPIDYLWSFSND